MEFERSAAPGGKFWNGNSNVDLILKCAACRNMQCCKMETAVIGGQDPTAVFFVNPEKM